VRAANLVLKFGLELAAIAALAFWGTRAADGVLAVVLAVGAPAVFIVLWGRFAAPRSSHRLSTRSRIPFELGLFALAALALVLADSPGLAAIFAALVAGNAALLTVFDQWEA
jgi:Kef-type K+ transport system membrane component KefB